MQENCHLTINVRTIVDIGNTNILFGNIVKGELISQMRIETSVIVNAQKNNMSIDLVELKNFLSDSKSVIISGVVPNAQYELTNFIKSIRDDLKIVELRTSDLEKFISFTFSIFNFIFGFILFLINELLKKLLLNLFGNFC